MNSIDLNARLNDLKILGNEQAELITAKPKRKVFENNASPFPGRSLIMNPRKSVFFKRFFSPLSARI